MMRIAQGPDRRYAKALFELATEQKLVSYVVKDAAALREALTGSEDIQAFLKSPLAPSCSKEDMLNGVLNALNAHALTQNFVKMVCRKGRAGLLAGMCDWVAFYNMQAAGILEAHVVSATPLSQKQKDALADTVKKQFPKTNAVQLEETVDARLQGGVRLTVGSLQWDATVGGAMQRLRRALGVRA